jgi:hypothetical protein
LAILRVAISVKECLPGKPNISELTRLGRGFGPASCGQVIDLRYAEQIELCPCFPDCIRKFLDLEASSAGGDAQKCSAVERCHITKPSFRHLLGKEAEIPDKTTNDLPHRLRAFFSELASLAEPRSVQMELYDSVAGLNLAFVIKSYDGTIIAFEFDRYDGATIGAERPDLVGCL